MNTPAFVAATALLAALSIATGCDRAKSVAGTWTTQFEGNGGTTVYIVEMSQNGSEVAGTYHARMAGSGAAPGTFAGRFQRNVLRATWMEQNGAQGWLNFKFDSTARAFNGEWGNLGRPLGGLWNGTRNP